MQSFKEGRPRCFVVWGPNAFLLRKAEHAAQVTWRAHTSSSVTRWCEEQLGLHALSEIFAQSGLFGGCELHILGRVKKQANLATWLKGATRAANFVVLTLETTKLQKELLQRFEALDATLIEAKDLKPYDYTALMQHMARQRKMTLPPQADRLLRDVLGDDLFALENELDRLSLHFPEGASPTWQELSGLLSWPKREHIFQLTRHLLDRSPAKAQQHVLQLLNSGESPLAVVSILARHCRHALAFKSHSQKLGAPTLPRLPFAIAKSYNEYVQAIPTHHFLQAMRLCLEADMTFKSRRISPVLPLSAIIDYL